MRTVLTLPAALLLASPAAVHAAELDGEAIVSQRVWQGIPGLERTAKGRVFVSWFTGGPKEPAPENTAVLGWSDDGGRTFSPPLAMALPWTDGTRCFDPCLWIDPRGRLWYLFNRGNKDLARHDVWARLCTDPDATPPVFGPEFRIGFDVPFAFRMNKVTVLSTGEWLLPVTHAAEPVHDWCTGFNDRQQSTLHGVAISTDAGQTWTLHGAVRSAPWALENMIVERRDGRLWMLIRTSSGVLWESDSSDRGRTWTDGQRSAIATPGSRFFIRRLSSGNLLLVNHFRFSGRSHMTAQLSTDEGATWNAGLLLDERGGVSYPDGVQDRDGLVWITYDRDRGGAGEILLARFREEDVVAGRDVSGAVALRQVVNRLQRPGLVPPGWDPALAGDLVLQRLVRVTAPQAKGAHDAEFVCVGERAYVVEHDNDVEPGHNAGANEYCVLTVVSLATLRVERTILLARSGQAFANVTLPVGMCFVPRIIRKDEQTLRCYFASQGQGYEEQMWYRDFNLVSQTFADTIHKVQLKTAAGVFDMQPSRFHADAVANGFAKPAVDEGMYLFDSFKAFDGKVYVALNNFPGKQNALGWLHADFATVEVIGHYNEPQAQQLSESAVNRLPDGTWMAICRNDAGNYHFTTSPDGRTWSVAGEMPFVRNGLNSKPTFDRFGGVYYLGWQENTRIRGANRSVFNVDISRDGTTWERKYRFETPESFQYPTFHEHQGAIWLSVTQSDHGGSSDRITFGRLEATGQFEPQAGRTRTAWPQPPETPTVFDPVDARTEPPVILTAPGPEYEDSARPGAMIIGMDRTPKGRLWGCWTGTGDKPDGYFVLATSDDDGATWSKPRLVVGALDPSGKRQRGALVGNLWSDPLGRLWLFFDQTAIGIPGPTANWALRCDQPDADAPVWSAPRYLCDGCTLNKPTVLSTGEWLLPVSHWAQKTAWVYASTDQGATWQPRGSVRFPDWEFDEHMMVELRDGRLWMLARTKGNPHECFSADRGATWTDPRPAASVQNINARFFLRRLASGRILLVKNGPPDRRLTVRSHLSAYLSDDEGSSWQGGLVLDERNGVSYPDGFAAPDGRIHILYDWNRHTDAEILLATFREADILAGKPVSADTRLRQRAAKATGPKPILYNGIELPLEWPPRHLDPASVEPMPVPYLQRPPRVIPIDVGRQLFVDDFLIESTTLKRTYHRAQKLAGNPVFRAATARELAASTEGERGEEATVFLGQGGVFYDPAEKLFKMFYVAGWRGPLALATSPDLVHWTRPDLGLAGGGNVLLPQGLTWTGKELRTGGSDNCVWLDLNAADPAERLKFLTCWMHVAEKDRPPGFNHSLHTGDGRTWSAAVPTDVALDDCGSFFYNPFRRKWGFSLKRGTVRGRSRYYLESNDFLGGNAWSKAVYWTNADRLDAPEPAGRYPGAGDAPQLYSLNAVAYESLMVGMHYIHRGPRNEVCDRGKFPKLIDLELGFSRDGFHWQRPDRGAFIAAARTEGAWDRAYLHSTAGVFVILDDQLVFPYMGTSGIAPNGHRGMYTGGAIGLATLRRDGFASLDAGASSGTLTTRPLSFRGRHLFVNLAAASGELKVEVLDGNGAVQATSLPLSGDRALLPVAWPDQADLARFAGRPTRFRFTLTNGSLYAFWVSRDQTGRSDGYLAAGGPAYPGVVDTVGTAAAPPLQRGARP